MRRSSGGPSNSRDYNGILADHWFKFHSGDGFHTTVDPNDWTTVYTETQNGSVRRLDATFRQQGSAVSPRQQTISNYAEVAARDAAGGQLRFRHNWSSPLILSPHDSNTLYLGSQYVAKPPSSSRLLTCAKYSRLYRFAMPAMIGGGGSPVIRS